MKADIRHGELVDKQKIASETALQKFKLTDNTSAYQINNKNSHYVIALGTYLSTVR